MGFKIKGFQMMFFSVNMSLIHSDAGLRALNAEPG